MNSLFGRINHNDEPIDQSLLKKSIDELSSFNGVQKDIFESKSQCFVKIMFPSIIEDSTKIKHSNVILVSDAKIYNRAELSKELSLSVKEDIDDIYVLKAFEKWGIDCVKHLLGDFAFAIWNLETEELFCARDHFGVKPFYYYIDEKSFVFSSEISSILAQKDLSFSIDEQYIADSISLIKSENFRSTYQEIKKLPPAHSLTLKRNKFEIKQYWELKPQKTIQKKDVEIIEGFKNLLIESVECRIRDEQNIGSELSGGIDSSSITALAARHKPVKTYSHVLPADLLEKTHPYKDEREFIELLADFCQISDHHFITSEVSLIKLIIENIELFKILMQQNFGMFSDQLYQQVLKDKISVLLSGFGGDEVTTSKSLGYLYELAENNMWDDLKQDLRNQNPGHLKFLKSFAKIYIKTKLPFVFRIIRLFKYKKNRNESKFKNLSINAGFAKKLKIKKRFQNFKTKNEGFSIQNKSIERISHPHVSQRLEECSLIARKYGIEYRYPLLDKRLIEYYLSMPTRLKARNGIGRYAIRKVLEGIVPKEIQWRNDKSGSTIPTVFMRMIKDREKIQEIITQAKSNKIVSKYIDLNKFEKWFLLFCNRTEKIKNNFNPGAFYNYLKLILFIDQNPSLFE